MPEQRGYRSLVMPKFMVTVIDHGKTNVEPVTAVAFARSIGLRQKGAFLAFIQDGHTPATLMKNATTGQAVYHMTENDIAAFRSLFTTLTMLSEEAGLRRNSLSRSLKMAGIMPFTPSGRNYGGIYLRQDVTSVIPKVSFKSISYQD